jgi:hypothetical protein
LPPTLNLGISGKPLNPLPRGISWAPPKAKDSMTFTNSNGTATIKVANTTDYQSMDMNKGVPTSPLKTRAEFDTMTLASTKYGEGDSRIYRTTIRLHDGWYWDDRSAIFTQFKRMSSGPDMFLAVKRHDIVLRIGSSYQATIVPNLATNKWVEVVMAVKWSASSSGKISAFYRYADEKNYHQIPDILGANLLAPANNTYVKFGIYKAENFAPGRPPTTSQILDIGNIAIY